MPRLKSCVFPLVLLLTFSGFLFSQSSESFYVKIFRDGEKAFQGNNYAEALKNFEIAVFGLHTESEMMASGNAYMTLCYLHLKDTENTDIFARKLMRWLGPGGLNNLDLKIDSDQRKALEMLLSDLGYKPVAMPPPSEPEPDETDSVIETPLEKPPVPEQPPVEMNTQDNAHDSSTPVQIPQEKTLKDIAVTKNENELLINLLCPPDISYNVFQITDPQPERIVIDLSGLDRLEANDYIDVSAFGIRAIRAARFKLDVVRVVLDASSSLPLFRVEKTLSGFRIIIAR